uniref:Uncharacterized protein n=1 Tax=Photinus pyralis TaxID=7054 RepID=A0A1Y1LBX6_PHOPY
MEISTEILTAVLNRRRDFGPYSKAAPHVSARPREGIFARLHISCDALTSMCTQYVHKNPTKSVPMDPPSKPAFLKATGIAKIPVPSELLSKWIRAPTVEFGCSTFLFSKGL